jgi:nucleoside-diphosphate-sugar epimerase
MRVLATGHKGHKGTILMPILIDAGYQVASLDNDLCQHCTFRVGMAKGTRFSRIAHLKSLVASLFENNLRWRTDEVLRSAAG